jgi:hypothetical protein
MLAFRAHNSIGLAVALLLASSSSTDAIQCHGARGHDGKYWAWRNVDGRKCWYAGNRGMSKKKLQWAIKAPQKRDGAGRKSVRPALIMHDRTKPLARSEPKALSEPEQLREPRSRSERKPVSAPKAMSDQDEIELLLQSIWPPLIVPAANFFERWQAIYQ